MTALIESLIHHSSVGIKYTIWLHCETQGRIQDFLKGGSESGVGLNGGNNPSVVSLKQGVWGAQPPRSYWVFD